MRKLVSTLSLGLLLASGCTGSIGDPSLDDGAGPDGEVTPEGASAPPSLRLPRLSHLQWARTAQAFLRLPETPVVSLRSDSVLQDAFATDDRSRLVDELLARDYRAAAEALADQVVDDPEALDRFVAEAGGGDAVARLRTLLEEAWPRAYRRSLSDDEIERYVAMATSAPGYGDAIDDDARLRAGLRVLLRVTLQSPHFVYRVELGDETKDEASEDGSRRRPLTPSEYAARLSYVLLDAPPDPAIIDDPPVTPEAKRALTEEMLGDPRARETLLAFHRALYAVDESRSMRKDATLYPGMDGLGADAATEAELFLDHVVASDGGLRELLLSRTTFVNRRLAGIYGLADDLASDGFDNRRELPAERGGILTRVSWTGKEADLVERASILRGVYVTRRVLCTPLGNPDASLIASAADPPADLETNRERVTYVTSPGACKGCHEGIINPAGFAFESFDAIGRYVTHEGDAPVDPSGTTFIDGEATSFATTRELLEKAAEAKQTHACYVGNLASWMFGHPLSEIEKADVLPVAERSRGEAPSVRALVFDLTERPSFGSIVVEAP